jgi:predicted nucleic acid-binding protein
VTRVVADASALAEYLLRAKRAPEVEAVLRNHVNEVAVPALCDVEVSSVLRRALLLRRLSPERAAEALADYRDLPLTRHGHLALLDRVLSLRDNFSAYDATYVALAERLDARLVTGDGALARAAQRHLGIEVVPIDGAT